MEALAESNGWGGKRKNAGKPKGRSNNFTMQQRKELIGELGNPVRKMAQQADRFIELAEEKREIGDEQAEVALRQSAVVALEKVSSYLFPKLKAIEVDLKGDTERPVEAAEVILTLMEQRHGRSQEEDSGEEESPCKEVNPKG